MSTDDDVAKALGMLPQQVAIIRDQWEVKAESVVIRKYFELKIAAHADEKLRKLRKCSPEELKGLQGELDGLELGNTVVTSRIV